MVSTHQQYLCPDYMPLSSAALDSNKSPLALLAQTCNSIGVPEQQSHNNGKLSSKSSVNGTLEIKLTCKDENLKNHHNNNAVGVTKPANQPADSTSDSYHSNNNINGLKNGHNHHHKKSNNSESEPRPRSNAENGDSIKRDSISASSQKDVQNDDNAKTAVNDKAISGVILPPAAVAGLPFAAAASGMYAAHCFPSTSGGVVFPFGGHNPAAALSAYYQPYHLSAMPALFPRLCTDPFCKSCPPNPGFSPMRGAAPPPSCPSGCTQCAMGGGGGHPDLSYWLNSYSSLINMQQQHGFSSSALSGLNPFLSGLFNNNNNNIANPNNNMAAGHVCSWLNGDKYCGKVFNSAEELLQHLRAHTHETSASTSTPAMTSSTSPVTSSGSVTSSGRLSPRSAYLSSLHSLRYHPYAGLGKMPTAGPPLPPHLAFPQLNPSLGVLFGGQRLPI